MCPQLWRHATVISSLNNRHWAQCSCGFYHFRTQHIYTCVLFIGNYGSINKGPQTLSYHWTIRNGLSVVPDFSTAWPNSTFCHLSGTDLHIYIYFIMNYWSINKGRPPQRYSLMKQYTLLSVCNSWFCRRLPQRAAKHSFIPSLWGRFTLIYVYSLEWITRVSIKDNQPSYSFTEQYILSSV